MNPPVTGPPNERVANFRTPAGAAAVAQRYRELLGTWPVPHEARTVANSAGDTFVVSSGPVDAPPVVALQGSGATTAMWCGRSRGSLSGCGCMPST